jgi:hypothetical protein
MLTIRSKETTSDGKVRIRCSMILAQQEEMDEDALSLDF